MMDRLDAYWAARLGCGIDDLHGAERRRASRRRPCRLPRRLCLAA